MAARQGLRTLVQGRCKKSTHKTIPHPGKTSISTNHPSIWVHIVAGQPFAAPKVCKVKEEGGIACTIREVKERLPKCAKSKRKSAQPTLSESQAASLEQTMSTF
eukprot:1136579-Pelagomonas_calceolata.AAC.4